MQDINDSLRFDRRRTCPRLSQRKRAQQQRNDRNCTRPPTCPKRPSRYPAHVIPPPPVLRQEKER
jgi:hypothetical protein